MLAYVNTQESRGIKITLNSIQFMKNLFTISRYLWISPSFGIIKKKKTTSEVEIILSCNKNDHVSCSKTSTTLHTSTGPDPTFRLQNPMVTCFACALLHQFVYKPFLQKKKKIFYYYTFPYL